MRGSAQIHDVSGSAQIHYVLDTAQVHDVRGSAQVHYVLGSAQVTVTSPNVTIGGLFFWSTLIMQFCVCKVLKKHHTAKIVKHVKTKISNQMFCDTLEKSGDGYIMYKSVNPDTLCDFRTGKIKYEGVVVCPDFDPSIDRECGGGLHLSPTPTMALNYDHGKVLRCEVKKNDFVIYQAGDFTKVRCRVIKVLGEAK